MFSKNKAVAKRRKNIIAGYISTVLFYRKKDDNYVVENFVDIIEKNLSEDFKVKSKIVTDNFLNNFIISNRHIILSNSLNNNSNIPMKTLSIGEEDDPSIFLYENLLNRSFYAEQMGRGIYFNNISHLMSKMIYDYKESCPMSKLIFSFFLNNDNFKLELPHVERYVSNSYTALKIILESIQNKSFDTDSIMKGNSSLNYDYKIDLIDKFSDKEDWFISRLKNIKRGDGFSARKASVISSAISNNVLKNSIAENCAKLTKSNKREIADELYYLLRRKGLSEDMNSFISCLIANDNTAIFSAKLMRFLDKKTIAFLLPKLTEDFKHDYWMTKRLKEIIEG